MCENTLLDGSSVQWEAECGPSHLGMEDEKKSSKMLHRPAHEMLIWQYLPSL